MKESPWIEKFRFSWLWTAFKKNCKAHFISMIENDAKFGVLILYDRLPSGMPRETLERVWKIWRNVGNARPCSGWFEE